MSDETHLRETFAPIDDVMEALESIPGRDDDGEARHEFEHTWQLAEVRSAHNVTQSELAKITGAAQPRVDRAR